MHNNDRNRIGLGNVSGSLERPGVSFSLASASEVPSSTDTDGAPNLYNAVTNGGVMFGA